MSDEDIKATAMQELQHHGEVDPLSGVSMGCLPHHTRELFFSLTAPYSCTLKIPQIVLILKPLIHY